MKKKINKVIKIEPIESAEVIDKDIKDSMDKSDPINIQNQSITNIIIKKDDLEKPVNNDEFHKKSVSVIKDLYNEYNKKYDLNLKLDVDDILSTLRNIIDPEKKKIFDIYTSELFDRFKSVFMQNMVLNNMKLMDKLNKNLSEDLSLAESLISTEKMFEFMKRINEFGKEFKNEHTEKELKVLSQKNNGAINKNISNEEARNVMKYLNKVIIETSTNTNNKNKAPKKVVARKKVVRKKVPKKEVPKKRTK